MERSRRDESHPSERCARRIRVLVVDDDPGMLDATTGLLESHSDRITATAASDAQEALAILAEDPVDCIVCDFQMPGLDGLELLERVRRDHGDLPFILFTGKGSEEIASEAISRGVTDYLQKGQDPERFTILANRTENAADQYLAEQDLERERVRRAALFENTDPIVEMVFEAGVPVVTRVNSRFERVFGLDESAVVGNRIADLIVPESEQDAHRTLSRKVREGITVETEVRRETADGLRDFSLRVVPITAGDSDAYAWYTDITERKERERELKRQNERLEEFASVLSHDFRNPLMIARAGVELARNSGSMDELDRVDRAHERMEALVADILTLAVQGQTIEDSTPLLLVPLVETVWQTIDHDDATLNVTLDRDYRVNADSGRLRRVLENLLSNAVRHGQQAVETPVAIRVGPLEHGFYIEDDGPGIPPEQREVVFDQGYSTGTDGTGFGLAIVRDIVEAHGWTVTVTEGTDGGARFEIWTDHASQ